jgi:hypothetical protein
MSFRPEGEILKQQPVVDKIIKPLEIQKSHKMNGHTLKFNF